MKFMEYNEFKDRDECVFDTEEANETLEEHTSQLNNIANKTILENGKLYLVRKDGTKIDTGTTLPSSGTGIGTDAREIELQATTDYIQWRYVGDADWANLVALSDLRGTDGDTGLSAYELAQQETGFAGTVEQWLNSLVGATPNLQIGTVETLASGSSATASITGTTENPLLNLGIPRGADGTSGTGGSSKEEQLSVTELATVVVPTGSSGVIEIGVSMGQLRQYKRFVIIEKGNSNVGSANTYFTFENNSKKTIARFSDGGFHGEYTLINKNLLECHAFTGNPSLVSVLVENYISYYQTINRGRDLQDISSFLDTDTLKVYYTNATTIDYTIAVYGLTKEVEV